MNYYKEMKRHILVFIFVLTAYRGFSQVNIIEETISFLGNIPPSNVSYKIAPYGGGGYCFDFYGYRLILYLQMNYEKDEEVVSRCTISNEFNTFDEAHVWLRTFYNIIENQNWAFLRNEGYDQRYNFYKKNDIYLTIVRPHYFYRIEKIYTEINLTYDLREFEGK
jgi:hypothetical protein